MAALAQRKLQMTPCTILLKIAVKSSYCLSDVKVFPLRVVSLAGIQLDDRRGQGKVANSSLYYP